MKFEKFMEIDVTAFVNAEIITIDGLDGIKIWLGEAIPIYSNIKTRNVQYPGLDWQSKLKTPIKNPYFGYGVYKDDFGKGIVSPDGIRIRINLVNSLIYRLLDQPYFVDTGLTCWQSIK